MIFQFKLLIGCYFVRRLTSKINSQLGKILWLFYVSPFRTKLMVWGLYYFLFWVLLLDIINYAGASLSAVLACLVTLANRSWLSIQFAHTGGSVSPSSNFLGQTNNPLKAELLPCWWWQWSECGAASSVHTLIPAQSIIKIPSLLQILAYTHTAELRALPASNTIRQAASTNLEWWLFC